MQYKRLSGLLLAAALLAQAALAQTAAGPAAPDAARLRAHVAYLASEKLEGRRTGTPGAQEAALYVAREFMRLRLRPGGAAPAGDLTERSYLQEFPYVASVGLGAGNALTATRRVAAGTQGPPLAVDFKVGEDWMPLGFGSNAKAEGGVVFVGYGITDAAQNYDDYKGADVAGRVALAFAGTPDGGNPHGRFTRAGEPRFKAAAARAAGARALVLIAADEKFADDKLSRLRYDNSGGDAGLPVAAVSQRAAATVLGLADAATLSNLEKYLGGWLLKYTEEVAKFQAGDPGSGGTAVGYHLLLNPRAGAQHDHGARNPALIEAPGVVISLTTDVARRNAPAANVVGVLEGSDARLKSEVIVVGAHYDHLGRGGVGSGSLGREGDVHYGADDNASGTAGLIELARLFSREPRLMRRTVVFVAFGGEEEGLIGSSFYVRNPVRPLEQTVAMLNMDMIGRLRGDVLNVGGVGTASEWRALIEAENKGYKVALDPSITGAAPEAVKDEAKGAGAKPDVRTASASRRTSSDDPFPIVVTGTNGRAAVTATPAERFALRLNDDGYGPSDHSAFYARRVPVLFFFTGSHEDYHKPTDTAERVNYDGQARVLQFVRDVVYQVQSRDRRPTYAVAKSEASARSTGFKVSLGTVPSYGDSTDGLKLDAVREGSPAAVAGLRAGDKIVRLAGRDVRNVYDYTQALSGMKAGQEYEVEVLRDGRRLSMKITPAARR
ncbi:MAG: M28 family peptidase [Acidobacteria bacterium]|nr:M28 family peptidase [Acidobacteriota bacterium]